MVPRLPLLPRLLLPRLRPRPMRVDLFLGLCMALLRDTALLQSRSPLRRRLAKLPLFLRQHIVPSPDNSPSVLRMQRLRPWLDMRPQSSPRRQLLLSLYLIARLRTATLMLLMFRLLPPSHHPRALSLLLLVLQLPLRYLLLPRHLLSTPPQFLALRLRQGHQGHWHLVCMALLARQVWAQEALTFPTWPTTLHLVLDLRRLATLRHVPPVPWAMAARLTLALRPWRTPTRSPIRPVV
jgi:hypothetical protein